jgi:cytochrome c556
VIADSGQSLEQRTPSKGSHSHWREQAKAFTAAATALVIAADKQDYPAARRGLQQLAARCAACHEQHR